MLSRAFLLLLALVSGLSAAQAADGARAGRSAEIASTLQALAQVEAASPDQAILTRPQQQLAIAPVGNQTALWVVNPAPAATFITTRLSDRLRA